MLPLDPVEPIAHADILGRRGTVEAVLGYVVVRVVAVALEVELARAERLHPVLLQHLRKRGQFQPKLPTVVRHTVMLRATAGNRRCASRHADWQIGEAVLESHAALGESIQMRRMRRGVAVAAQPLGAELVGLDEKHVHGREAPWGCRWQAISRLVTVSSQDHTAPRTRWQDHANTTAAAHAVRS